jgi:LPXTG-site transpeptidase (sortase) family protein
MKKKVYIKDESFDPIYREVSKGFYAKTRLLPSLLFFSGMFVFATQVLLPVLVFKTHDTSINLLDNATVLGRAAGFYKFQFDELELLEEREPVYNNGSVLGKSGKVASPNKPNYFYLTIPKLKIEDALVETNSKTLNPSSALGHYPGTSLPGETGNAFIYGHSVLPWFFNANNYKTIFSTLGRLEPGDEFSINYNNREYTYVVETREEVSPAKVKPLAEIKPKYLNESTVVLMTCSPPGTKLKRLLISGILVD